MVVRTITPPAFQPGVVANEPLQSSEVCGNEFPVHGPAGASFFYLVHGTRCNVEVEPAKHSVVVSGDGPYKWISGTRS